MTELTPNQIREIADEIASRLAERIENQSALLNYHGLAQWLGVSVPHVERLKGAGQIPFVAIGRRIMFDRGSVLAALSSKCESDKTANSPEKSRVVSE